MTIRFLSGAGLACVLFVAWLPLAAAQGQSDRISSNLLQNGDFHTDLAGWFEEDHPDFTSNWDSRDFQGSSASGSLEAGAKETGSNTSVIVRLVVWQCIDAVPGERWSFGGWVREHPDSLNWLGTGGTLRLAPMNVPGECPGTDPMAGDISLVMATETSEWQEYHGRFVVPAGISRYRVGVSMSAQDVIDATDNSEVVSVDHLWVGREKPLLTTSITVSDTTPTQAEPFQLTLKLDNSGDNSARDVTADLHFTGEFDLLQEGCPGDFVEITQGASRRFHWFNVPTIGRQASQSCTLTLASRGSTLGAQTFEARVFSSDANLDDTDGYSSRNITLQAAPDHSAALVLGPAHPAPGRQVTSDVTWHNVGQAGGSARLAYDGPEAWPITDSNCSGFGIEGDGTASRIYLLAPGAQLACSFTHEVPQDFPAEHVQATASVAVVTGPADPVAGNNSATAGVGILRLRVNSSTDGGDRVPGDGICETQSGNDRCTLRAAVMEAAALGGNRTIELPYLSSPYLLTVGGTDDDTTMGDVDVRSSMRIVGEPSAGGTLPRVQGALAAEDADRLFDFRGGTNTSFQLSNVELIGQNRAPVHDAGNGGLVYHDGGKLLLRDVTLRNGRSHGSGGGLYSTARRDLDLQRVLIEDNQATSGGGLALSGDAFSFVTIEDSRITGNLASLGGGGVLVDTALASVVLERSTVDDNDASNGGGIAATSSPLLALRNATVSGNRAGNAGGGIYAVESHVQLGFSTIASNAAAPQDPDAGFGGGIYEMSSDVVLYGSIVSSNTADRSCTQPEPTLPPICLPLSANCEGTVQSQGYSAMAADGRCTFDSQATDYRGAVSLAALADNGGFAPTHAPGSFLQIVDAGPQDCRATPAGQVLATDQRGMGRPADGDGDETAVCDRGAYELSSSRVLDAVIAAGEGRIVSSPAGIACGHGTSNACSALFVQGSQVTLTATAAPGFRFARWNSSPCRAYGDNPCVVTMGGMQYVSAVFEPADGTRTVAVEVLSDVAGAGGRVQSSPSGIDCPGTCSADFAHGADVSLQAIPDPGSDFLGFDGPGCSGAPDACELNLLGDRNVTALFGAQVSEIAVSLAGTGVGRVRSTPVGIDCPGDCSNVFLADAMVSLEAEAAVGSQFLGWGGACSGNGACVLAADQGHSVEARFDLFDGIFTSGFEE